MAAISPSTKFSLRAIRSIVDTRDKRNDPSSGHFLQTSLELAGPPGSAQFFRAEGEAQAHWTIGPSLFLKVNNDKKDSSAGAVDASALSPSGADADAEDKVVEVRGAVLSLCGALGILRPLGHALGTHAGSGFVHLSDR